MNQVIQIGWVFITKEQLPPAEDQAQKDGLESMKKSNWKLPSSTVFKMFSSTSNSNPISRNTIFGSLCSRNFTQVTSPIIYGNYLRQETLSSVQTKTLPTQTSMTF